MPERVWYRSLYWRIAIGYVALLAVLLVIQSSLVVWLTNRSWGRATRTPAQLAELVAKDLSDRLAADADDDLRSYVVRRYGSGYQPFVVVLADGRAAANRPRALPPDVEPRARARLFGREFREAELPNGRRPDDGRGRGPGSRGPRAPPFAAEYADILVAGKIAGIVAVPQALPPLTVGLRELMPRLLLIGAVLLGVGAAAAALLIFRPTHRRLRSLEDAARALGEGRTDVRAIERGGDEVSALAATFNQMAADLETRRDALIASDRARRQLLADVSHELMTPLAAIRGYVETLAMTGLPLDEATRARYLGIAHQETHKLEAIIGDLLDLARLEGGGGAIEEDEVLVDDLFRRVVDRHRPVLAERTIALESTVAPGTPHIRGDADRLEQALQNVAANAIRHTPTGGMVTLHAEPAGPCVRIVISDTGPGIPIEHLPHVFDRFYKVDAARAGTSVASGSGLGLSIVRAIVTRHGGAVFAANTAGGGAQFEISLPAFARESGSRPSLPPSLT